MSMSAAPHCWQVALGRSDSSRLVCPPLQTFLISPSACAIAAVSAWTSKVSDAHFGKHPPPGWFLQPSSACTYGLPRGKKDSPFSERVVTFNPRASTTAGEESLALASHTAPNSSSEEVPGSAGPLGDSSPGDAVCKQERHRQKWKIRFQGLPSERPAHRTGGLEASSASSMADDRSLEGSNFNSTQERAFPTWLTS